jgi:hypothetical protein
MGANPLSINHRTPEFTQSPLLSMRFEQQFFCLGKSRLCMEPDRNRETNCYLSDSSDRDSLRDPQGGWSRSAVAESVLAEHALLLLNRSRFGADKPHFRRYECSLAGQKEFFPAMLGRSSAMPAKRASRKTKSRRVFGHGQKKQIRAGLYARVSTHDQQRLRLQNRAMQDYAARRGWNVAIEIKEVGSGASVRELRQKLLDAARRRDIDVVIVWRLDRWGRSMADLVTTLQELRDLDVGFVSLTEALDLTTPSGRAMAGLLAVFADDAESAIMQSYRIE